MIGKATPALRTTARRAVIALAEGRQTAELSLRGIWTCHPEAPALERYLNRIHDPRRHARFWRGYVADGLERTARETAEAMGGKVVLVDPPRPLPAGAIP